MRVIRRNYNAKVHIFYIRCRIIVSKYSRSLKFCQQDIFLSSRHSKQKKQFYRIYDTTKAICATIDNCADYHHIMQHPRSNSVQAIVIQILERIYRFTACVPIAGQYSPLPVPSRLSVLAERLSSRLTMTASCRQGRTGEPNSFSP